MVSTRSVRRHVPSITSYRRYELTERGQAPKHRSEPFTGGVHRVLVRWSTFSGELLPSATQRGRDQLWAEREAAGDHRPALARRAAGGHRRLTKLAVGGRCLTWLWSYWLSSRLGRAPGTAASTRRPSRDASSVASCAADEVAAQAPRPRVSGQHRVPPSQHGRALSEEGCLGWLVRRRRELLGNVDGGVAHDACALP